jgi:hypothetical protein
MRIQPIVFALALSFVAIPVSAFAQSDWKATQFGDTSTFAEFHGFSQITYSVAQPDSTEPLPESGAFLNMEEFYLSIRARVSENLMVLGELEFANGGPSEGAVQTGLLSLDRLFIQWRLHPRFLTLRFGKVFMPFGMDPFVSMLPAGRTGNPLVTKPIVLQELRYEEWLDTALEAYGLVRSGSVAVTYDAAVANGPAGITPEDLQNQDNNRDKTGSFRLGLLPSLDEGYVNAGVSIAHGVYNHTGDRAFTLYGADAQVIWRGVELRGEYMQRTGDDQPLFDDAGNPAGVARADAQGFYVLAAYKVIQGPNDDYYLQPVVRYEVSDIPDETDPYRFKRTAIGLNYSPRPHFLLKAEVDFTQESGTEQLNDAYLFGATIDF